MDILKLSEFFKKAVTKNMQQADVEDLLIEKGLWGGPDLGTFDTNSPVGKKIFKILDKYAPPEGSFKIDTVIHVPNSLKVTISAKAPSHSEAIAHDLTQVFGRAMSDALKQSPLSLHQIPVW